MKKILIICTGNTCRSPMAKVIAEDIFAKKGIKIEVVSAGINVFSPAYASRNAVETVGRRNLDLSEHISKQACQEDYEDSDLILTMADGHKRYLVGGAPHIEDKVFTLSEYVTGINEDVEDPFGGDSDEYERCFNRIESLITSLADKLDTME